MTVTGADDNLADGNQTYAIAFTATSSADPGYSGRIPANVMITNFDNDSAGIAVSAISSATSEAGGLATFSIFLRSQPLSPVTVNFATSDSTEGLTSAASRTFSTSNYGTPQSVTVTGLDDLLLDGDQLYSVNFSATSSADAQYAAILPPNIPVTNSDDDVSRSVLVLHSSSNPAHLADIDAKLEGTGAFAAVDAFDASVATPTLAQLGLYGSVLVVSEGIAWNDAASVGDVLADYFDAGNQVVLAYPGGIPIGGRFGTTANGYLLIGTSGSPVATSAALGMNDPTHFLMRNVGSFSATSALRSSGGLVNGAVAVASWNDGTPLVVRNVLANGRVRADLNFYAPSNAAAAGSWTGAGAELLRNALLFDGGMTPAPTPTPTPGPTPTPTPATCGTNDVTFNGRCYYLDGTRGVCQAGYQLVSQSILSSIAPMFAGKNYKTQISDNCCITNSDGVQNWGMVSHCNVNGPFSSNEPALGGTSCTNVNPPNNFTRQLTLCGTP